MTTSNGQLESNRTSGYAAFKKGLNLASCPFEPSDCKRNDWVDGWVAARDFEDSERCAFVNTYNERKSYPYTFNYQP
jgi:ribosome modulation factor